MNKVGTILELKKDQATVMTEECRYIYIKRRPGMYVGQQVLFDESDIKDSKTPVLKYASLAACFAVVILFTLISYFKFYSKGSVYAYVDIDINPSLEVVIDKGNVVLDAKPINEDGRNLLKDLKLKGKTFNQAMEVIVEQSRKNGFIKADIDNYLLVSASLNPDTNEYKRSMAEEEKKLEGLLNLWKGSIEEKEKERIITKVISTTPEDRERAVENRMSTGRYYLYLMAREKGMDIPIEELKNSSVSDVLKRLKADTGGIGTDLGDNSENNKSIDKPSSSSPEKTTDAAANAGSLRPNSPAQTPPASLQTPIPSPTGSVQPIQTPLLPTVKPDKTPARPTATPPPSEAVQAPGPAEISVDNANNTGTYQIKVTIEQGNTASSMKLYENENDIMSAGVISPKTIIKSFEGKQSGTYTYRCELINPAGTSSSSVITVVVSRKPNQDGTWEEGAQYSVGTVVDYKGNKYRCIQAHTSQSDWEPPSTPALWQKQVTVDARSSWQTGISYKAGDEVLYNGAKYKCIQAHMSMEGWEPPNVPALWAKQ